MAGIKGTEVARVQHLNGDLHRVDLRGLADPGSASNHQHPGDQRNAERLSRRAMQIENDYDKEVYNGDLGVVSRIDMEESELRVDFDGREVIYGFTELDELVLAYATTIHKSQGSEYPAVVIPLTTQH
jgi:ATP-dependent exoDNAse (exonuclease V) alpha subunit